MVHHVTLTMPDDLYQALLRRTQETGRSLEETAADLWRRPFKVQHQASSYEAGPGRGLRRARCLGPAR